MKGLWGISISFLTVTLNFGYSYDVKALRKWDLASNRYHYFIGYCDFHDKVHPANDIQQKKLKSSCRNAIH